MPRKTIQKNLAYDTERQLYYAVFRQDGRRYTRTYRTREEAQAALEGAKAGLEATKNMKPKYGKAAVVAAKALGTEDQGATAGMLLVQGLRDGIVK